MPVKASAGRLCVAWSLRGALTLAALLLTAPVARAESVDVIANGNHAQIAKDRAVLRAVFTMRMRQWPDGVPVRVFVLPDSDEVHDRFVREQLGTFPYVLRSTWDRLVFTGTGFAPTIVHSEEEMRRRVQATPGAIGYARGGPQSYESNQRPDGVRVSWGGMP